MKLEKLCPLSFFQFTILSNKLNLELKTIETYFSHLLKGSIRPALDHQSALTVCVWSGVSVVEQTSRGGGAGF